MDCSNSGELAPYLYFLAVAKYRLCEYPAARKYVSRLLHIEPANRHARALRAMVDDRMARDSVISLASTVATLGGVVWVASKFLRRRRASAPVAAPAPAAVSW
jgi:fission 1 protein